MFIRSTHTAKIEIEGNEKEEHWVSFRIWRGLDPEAGMACGAVGGGEGQMDRGMWA